MNHKRFLMVVLLTALVCGWLWSSLARGQGASFLIEGADETRYQTLTVSSILSSYLNALGTHFVVDNADGLRHAPLAYPWGLHEALNGLSTHFVLDMADGNRFAALAYPQTLIGDTTPPRETEPPSTTPGGAGSVKIRWKTNEFSRGAVEYGLFPGQYNWTVTEPLFAKAHEVTLGGLTTGQTYYYRLVNTDRASNVTRTPERTFSAGQTGNSVFLPMAIDR